MPDQRPAAQRDTVLTGRSLLLSFTGLIPVALMVPILVLHLYAIGIIEGLAAGGAVITYHAARNQGITSVDLLAVGFSGLNAVLYFGFDDRTLIAHLDIAIYTLLSVLVSLSLIRRQPWTAQFARRVTPAEMWDEPAFQAINMRLSSLWGVAFLACDGLAVLGSGPARIYGPIAVMVATALAVPRIARWYRVRLTAMAAELA